MEGMHLIQIGGIYEEILNGLRPWKIMDQRALFNSIGLNRDYRNFTKKIQKLCKYKWLNKTVGPTKNQSLIFPSEKAIKEYYQDKSYVMPEEQTYHNFLTAKMVEFLMKYDRFIHFNMTFDQQIANASVEPDAMLKGDFNGKKFVMALEMELHQKEGHRVKKKFREYMASQGVDRVLYCFNKFEVFKSYHKLVMTEDFPYPDKSNTNIIKKNRITDKIILLYDENLYSGKFNAINSPCFYKGKDMTFKEALKL